jgi:hypothetical protein
MNRRIKVIVSAALIGTATAALAQTQKPSPAQVIAAERNKRALSETHNA